MRIRRTWSRSGRVVNWYCRREFSTTKRGGGGRAYPFIVALYFKRVGDHSGDVFEYDCVNVLQRDLSLRGVSDYSGGERELLTLVRTPRMLLLKQIRLLERYIRPWIMISMTNAHPWATDPVHQHRPERSRRRPRLTAQQLLPRTRMKPLCPLLYPLLLDTTLLVPALSRIIIILVIIRVRGACRRCTRRKGTGRDAADRRGVGVCAGTTTGGSLSGRRVQGHGVCLSTRSSGRWVREYDVDLGVCRGEFLDRGVG